MSFLSVQKILKLVTTQRLESSFFPTLNDFEVVDVSTDKRVIFIFNYSLAKALLRSKHAGTYDFLSTPLNLYGRDNFPILKMLSSLFPIFLDGQNHSVVREQYNQALAKVQGASLEHFSKELKAIIRQKFKADCININSVASDVSKAAMESILRLIPSEEIKLSYDFDYENMDFFNTLPTKSVLAKTESELQNFCSNMQLKTDTTGILALSIVTMGYLPLKAMVAAYLNKFISNPEALSNFEFQNVVPTNFVMREALKDFSINYRAFNKKISSLDLFANDVTYIFLGEGSGCPFSYLNSLPFGAGRHTCPGKGVSQRFLKIISNEFTSYASLNPGLSDKQIIPASILRHRSSAFLSYR